MGKRTALLHLASRHDEALWRAGLEGHGVTTLCVASGGRGVIDAAAADERARGADVLVADFPLLEASGHAPWRLPAGITRLSPGIRVFGRLPRRARVTPGQRAWARHHGYEDLLPGHSLRHARQSLMPALGTVLATLGVDELDASCAEAFIARRSPRSDRGHPDVEPAFEALAEVDAAGVTRAALAESLGRFRAHGVANRNWRGRTYRECFVSSEAVDWLHADMGLERTTAVAAGRMLQGFGILHHVVREQVFDDENLFFRFDTDGPGGEPDLAALAVTLRAQLPVTDRTYLGRTYRACFTGSGAVDWLAAHLGVGVGHAESIGQRLSDLGVFRHVTNDHDFMDAGYYYGFRGF